MLYATESKSCPKPALTLHFQQAFSGDGRWLAAALGDGTVRVYDLPTSQCIDWFKVDSPITSLSFSPRSDFLATTHVDSNGIYLWYAREKHHTCISLFANVQLM